MKNLRGSGKEWERAEGLKGRGKKKDQFFQSSQLLIHGNLVLRTAEGDAHHQQVSQLPWPLTFLTQPLGFPSYCWLCIYTALPRYCSGGWGINTARQRSVTPVTVLTGPRMALIRASSGFLCWENSELLSDTMNSPTAELPPWDSVPACTVREARTTLGQTFFVAASIVLSCAMIDMGRKACCSYSSEGEYKPSWAC